MPVVVLVVRVAEAALQRPVIGDRRLQVRLEAVDGRLAAFCTTIVVPSVSGHLDVLVLVVEDGGVEPYPMIGEQRLQSELGAVQVLRLVVLDERHRGRAAVDAAAAEAAAPLQVAEHVRGPLQVEASARGDLLGAGRAGEERALLLQVAARLARHRGVAGVHRPGDRIHGQEDRLAGVVDRPTARSPWSHRCSARRPAARGGR